MRRREIYDDEQEPLIDSQNDTPVRHQWNLFKNEPRKTQSGSTVESKYIDVGIKYLKFFTVCGTFLIVLASAVISKGTLLFMTSQIKQNVTRPYCNKLIDKRQQFIVSLPEEERTIWIWLVIFSYFVPELGTFLRSLRIIFFKSWKMPTFWEFFWLALTESLPAIGSALLVFVVFPELDVIKAAMLTNAVCFIPGIVAFFSRSSSTINSSLKMVLDIIALIAQASAFIVWPLVEKRPVLYVIPLAVLLISFGWWENFVSDKSPIKFISQLAEIKKEFQNKTYFIYSILAPWKCVLFFATALSTIWIREGSIDFLFDNFSNGFQAHQINITEIEPIVGASSINFQDAVATENGTSITTSAWTPWCVWLFNVVATYICYIFGKFSCKILIQPFGFALPANLTVPVLLTALIAMCGNYNKDECAYADTIPPYLFFNVPTLTYLNDFIAHQHSWVWLIWLLSQTWITVHIWKNNEEKLATTEKLFFKPMYDAFLIDQSIAMNRRTIEEYVQTDDKHETNKLDVDKDKITRIYACGTMWHETKEEMIEFLKSIFRMDEDQCAHRIVRNYLQYNLPSYYEFETHIFFDDAFVRVSQDDKDPHVNSYVSDLIESVSVAAGEVHATNVKVKPPVIYPTPYGGRLVWTLPGKTKMIAHLKDKAFIRPKKRWSQVMYMYYLLGFRILDNDTLTPNQIKNLAKNTYILALDGDIDFQPHAVHLLVDYMKKNLTLGAACGRIHPIGSGALAWYQIFEYAVGHWLQKATEHVIGCVLCSPGCFSLFRAGALMDDNVMAKYTTVSEEPRHFVQYDQGEDRWLCTLMLQRGYRVEYSAASDAYTHCPEGFNEFYNQRRRWMPSTTANIMDLLSDYKHIIKINENISKLYILYQVVLMIGTAIGPGTIFLMLVGAFVAAFKVSQWISFSWNIVPILIFVIVCACCKADTQLFFAGIISGVYGLVMMAVLIGIMMQIESDGWLAPSSLFFFCLALEFVITALMHPQEFYCLKYGVIYYVTIPSMYMLLVIYSIFNMNNVSWGTREVTVVPKPQEQNEAEKDDKKAPPEKEENKTKKYSFLGLSNDDAGAIEFSFAGLFKLMCCTFDKNAGQNEILKGIQTSLQQMQQKLDYIERNQYSAEPLEPRKTGRGTILMEGTRPSRLSRLSRASVNRNSVSQMKRNAMEKYDDNFDDDGDDDESIMTPSDDVQENSWFYDGELIKSEVTYLEKKEEKFWEDFIGKYLKPLDESKKKEKVTKDLKDLRDKMVITFFMINSLFVLVMFLLTLQKDILHMDWPVEPKINFTYLTDQNEIYIQKEYLELEPIGFLFLICFALLMVVQFIAMLQHRFGTYCQIMANTNLDWNLFESSNVNDLTEEQILEKDPIKIFKKLIRLQGINDDEDDDQREVHVGRRNTAHFLAMKKQKKPKRAIEYLDEAFATRMKKIEEGEMKEKDLPIPRKTVTAINNRRVTIHNRRKSQMPDGYNERPDQFQNRNEGLDLTTPPYNGLLLENPAYEESEF